MAVTEEPQHQEPPAEDSAADLEQAEKWIKNAATAALIVALLSAALAVASIWIDTGLGIDLFVVIDALIALALAYWIRRKSRTAAVLMLVIYIGNRLLLVEEFGGDGIGVLTFIFAYFFIQGVRGTFRHHRLTTAQPEPADMFAQSDEGTTEQGWSGPIS